jgi:abelson tyrosine-protein kinase 1
MGNKESTVDEYEADNSGSDDDSSGDEGPPPALPPRSYSMTGEAITGKKQGKADRQAVFDSLGAPKAAKAKVSPLTNRKDQAGRKSKAGDDMLLPGGLVSKQDARASHTRGLVPEVSKSPTPVRSSVSTASAAVAEDESAAGEMFVALFDYEARSETELGFKKGDKFRIHSRENDIWWEAECLLTKKRGWLPSNYVAQTKSVENQPWFHGKISRTAAEHLLTSGINGSFLIRESESNPGEYSISLRYEGKMFHYRIMREGNMVFITKENKFLTLMDLVKHHSKAADGLVSPLKYAQPKKDKPTVYGMSHQTSDKWEIERTDIQLGRKLGHGQYGDVYEGKWKKSVHVAVKTLKEDTMEVKEFLEEASMMKNLRHPNIIQLMGVCTREPPYYVVTEFMSKGDLLNFLRSSDGQKMAARALMYFAVQIASGMKYLEERNFLHRDLAARNCLVGENDEVKIADFGLSRITENEYTAHEGAKFPIKWTAPESLLFNRFTSKSDCWSYGVLLWELATYGSSPYPGVDLGDVLEQLEGGYRMPKPEGCPDALYALMKKCWEWDVADRPSFAQIKDLLETMYASVNKDVYKTLVREGSIRPKKSTRRGKPGGAGAARGQL